MRPLLIDTDIGTDVDDLMVLAMLPRAPEVELVLITTAYGDVRIRRDIAEAVCDALDLNVRIAPGRSLPLSGPEVFWPGHEGAGLIDVGDRVPVLDSSGDGDGVAAIIEASHVWPGRLEILAIAPLTNIAAAVIEDPSLVERVRTVHVMGGDFNGILGGPEHNFACDPRAAKIVVESGLSLVLCGFDSTSRIMFREPERDRLAATGPIGELVAAQMTRFWGFIDEWAPREHRGGNMPHDPLAFLTMTDPSVFRTDAVRLEVDDIGITTTTPDTKSTTRIVVDFDMDEAAQHILARLGAGTG